MENPPDTRTPPDEEAVMRALRQVLESSHFRNSERMREFLTYVVVEALQGRSDRIKSYSIAIEVFGRNADFDASQDPIVRTTANRLRSYLERFNGSEESTEDVVIQLPKGKYVPTFEFRSSRVQQPAQAAPVPAAPVPAAVPVPSGSSWLPHRWWMIVGALVLLGVVIAAVAMFSGRTWSQAAPAGGGKTLLLVSDATAADANSQQLAASLSPLLIGRLAAHGGVRVVRDNRGTDGVRDASFSTNANDDVYALEMLVRDQNGAPSIVWRLSDEKSHEIAWASEEILEAGASPDTAADTIVSRILGLEGAIPTLLSMAYEGTDDQRACLTKPQRLALIYHAALEVGMRTCLEELVAQEPNNAEAWGVLAQVYFRLARRAASFGEDPLVYTKLLEHASARASELDPQAYMTQHASLYATYNRGQLTAFEEIARGMLRQYKDPHLRIRIGNAFANIGMAEEGMGLVRQGIEELDEHEGLAFLSLAYERYYYEDYAGALDMANRVTSDDYYLVALIKVISLAKLGRSAEVADAVAALHALRPNYEKNLYFDFRHNNVVDPVIDSIADGLRAAGLVVPVPPPAASSR